MELRFLRLGKIGPAPEVIVIWQACLTLERAETLLSS